MDKRYRVKKILNNNVVYATANFLEYIVIGLGIGFHLKPNQVIPTDKIERVFSIDREDIGRVVQLAQDVPAELFTQLYTLISDLSEAYHVELNPHAYIALIDHIQFALYRFKNNQVIPNMMAADLKIIYPKEYEMGAQLLRQLNESLEILLPEDEVGFLTVHLVNGMESGLNNQTNLVTECIYDCLNIIRDHYLIPLKLEDPTTQRIMVHLKMLLQRVISKQQMQTQELILSNVMLEFKRAYACSLKIEAFIETRLKAKLNPQEMVYLTIHLNRIEMTSTNTKG